KAAFSRRIPPLVPVPFGQNRREKVPSNGGDVDGAQVGGPALGPDGEHGPGGGDGGDAGHGVLHGGAADLEAVGIVAAAPGGGVDHQIHRAGGDHVQNVGVGLGDAVHPAGRDTRLVEHLAGAAGGQDLAARVVEAPGNAHDLLLVLVLDGDDHPAALPAGLQVGALEGLQHG